MRQETGKLRDLSFDTISGAGPNGAIVHYRATPATERTLEPGSLYLVDSGGQYRDGTTDITRTVGIGTPTPEMKDRFTRVLKGHIALGDRALPGRHHRLAARRARPLLRCGRSASTTIMAPAMASAPISRCTRARTASRRSPTRSRCSPA